MKRLWVAPLIFILNSQVQGNTNSHSLCKIQPDTVIAFSNGINTTKKEAELNSYATRTLLKNSLSANDLNKLIFKTSYNPTDGVLLDFWESVQQDIETDIVGFLRAVSNVDGATINQPILDKLKELIASSLDYNSAYYYPKLLDHINYYKKAISSGQRVVVVAHSQGNFYVNIAATQLNEEELKNFDVVSVANPDSTVATGGSYTTLHEDLVIAGINGTKKILGLPLPLKPNISNHKATNGPDYLGHNYQKAYLEKDSDSRNKIVNDIVTAINSRGDSSTSEIYKGTPYKFPNICDDLHINPSVAALENGGSVVTWTSQGKGVYSEEREEYIPSHSRDGSSTGIFAQRFNPDGSLNGAEFLVNTSIGSVQQNASVTALKDGGFVIVWEGYGTGTDKIPDFQNYYVISQRYKEDGSKFGEEINIGNGIYNSSTKVFPLDNEFGYIVFWASYDGNNNSLYGQKFDINNQPDGNQILYGSENPYAGIVVLEGGFKFISIWLDTGKSAYNIGRVRGRIYDIGYGESYKEFIVPTKTDYQLSSRFTPLMDGGFLITFRGQNEDEFLHKSGNSLSTGKVEVYAQRYDSNGFTQGSLKLLDVGISPQIPITSYTLGSSSSVIQVSNNEFIYMWSAAWSINISQPIVPHQHRHQHSAIGEVHFIVDGNDILHLVNVTEFTHPKGRGNYGELHRAGKNGTIIHFDGSDIIHASNFLDQISDGIAIKNENKWGSYARKFSLNSNDKSEIIKIHEEKNKWIPRYFRIDKLPNNKFIAVWKINRDMYTQQFNINN